jgi:hypothetical protein
MHDELERIRKEAIETYFEVLSLNLPGEIEENRKKPQSK